MSPQTPAPVVIFKKKGGHGGHHGGAWKVAYADFVTAMMALFIVLWLMNSSEQVKKAISAYFRDPSGTGKESGSSSTGTGDAVSVGRDDMSELKDKLEAAVKKSPEMAKLKDYVQMSVTGEGLRVELIETEKGMFFESGSPLPSEIGKALLLLLTKQLAQLPNSLLIEGHTDARPFTARAEYSNWELSTDRANAARRLMEANGVREHQIIQVRGYADNKLRVTDDPNAAANRRISVIVRYQDVPKGDVIKDDVTKIDVTKEDLAKTAEVPASPKNVGKK
jgi:chemotaxis protein MotB